MQKAKSTPSVRLSVTDLALISLMTALTCVLAPQSIPIGPVPISLTMLVIFFSLYILGMKKSTLSYLLYLLLGFAGLPVFSGFTAGAGKLLGPTGGYLIGFLPMTVIAGLVVERFYQKRILCFLAMLLGTAVCYLFGTLWLAYVGGYSFVAALHIGVLPFLPVDFLKMALAAAFGPQLRKLLLRARVLKD